MFGNFININRFDGLNEMSIITVYLGNAIIQQNQLPLVFCQQQFIQFVQQLAKENRPMKCICTRQVLTEETERQISNSLIFMNNTYVKEFGEKEKEDG
jgi:hypothetical protein